MSGLGSPSEAVLEPDEAAAEDSPAAARAAEAFSGRVLVMFLTHVTTAAIGVVNGFVLAAMIGPSGKGDYYLLTFLPNTIMVIVQFGLPQAFSFYAARGQTARLTSMAVILAAILSGAALLAVIALLPVLHGTFLGSLEPALILFGLAGLPLLLNATFTTAIVVGRQAVRWVAGVNVVMTIGATVLIVVLVGVLGLGVPGAVAAYVATDAILATGFLVASLRARRAVPDPRPVAYRELFRYGLPLYPGSLTMFFGYRIDVYLLAWLLADPSASLGYYSMAVSMAELVFFFPNAVSTFFFPHVAGSARADSDRQVPKVCRVTLLLTIVVALALAPAATVAISVLLPAFVPALPALYILLPGVVALSLTKVLAGYVSGLEKTGMTSLLNVGAFVLNVVANLVLIPRFGFVGAAMASLISYTASAVAFSVLAGRLSHARLRDFWLPRLEDVAFVVATGLALGGRVLRLRASRA